VSDVTVAALSDASLAARRDLARLGRRYFNLGWLFGTVGNLSARVPGSSDRVVITASGKHKGDLEERDFVEVSLDGTLLAAGHPGGRASAETSIHLAVYRTHPNATFGLHVHTIASTLLVAHRGGQPPTVAFEGLEMLKAWDLWDESVVAELPLFANHADVADIGREVEAYYRALPPTTPAVPALIVRGHGITAWGTDAFTANRHLEATEFLCQIERARTTG